MCNKAVLENGGILELVHDNYKNKKNWNQAIDDYVDGIQYASGRML